MIIDFHTHLFPSFIRSDRERFFEGEPAFKLLYNSAESRLIGAKELIDTMDEDGVDRSVVFGFPWNHPLTIQKHNDYIIDVVASYPNRLIGLCCFDMDYKNAAEETARCLDAGLSGVGELAAYLTTMNESVFEKLDPVMELCRAGNLPVLLHANEPVGHNYPGKELNSLAGVYRFLRYFRNNTIVLAHWGGGLFFYTLLKKEVRENLNNVYFDTAASPFLYRVEIYKTARDLVGIEKLLFGSDYPLIKPARYFKELKQSGLTPDEIKRIMGENAAGILNLK